MIDSPASIDGTTPLPVCELLSDLAECVPAKQAIVEIGVYKGRTLAYLAEGAKRGHGAHVWGVDVFDLPGPPLGRHRVTSGFAHGAIRELGLADQVTIIEARSVDAAVIYDGPEIGLLFIDGGHTKQAVLSDLVAWRSHLAHIATVVFDDYGLTGNPGVRQAVEEFGLDVMVSADNRVAITTIVNRNGKVTSSKGSVSWPTNSSS